MFDYDKFKEAIIKNMKYKDTYHSIGEKTGVSVSTMSRILNGKGAKIETILKICRWLDQPITDFIN